MLKDGEETPLPVIESHCYWAWHRHILTRPVNDKYCDTKPLEVWPSPTSESGARALLYFEPGHRRTLIWSLARRSRVSVVC